MQVRPKQSYLKVLLLLPLCQPQTRHIFDQAFAITVLTIRLNWSQIDLFSLNGCLVGPSGSIFTLNGSPRAGGFLYAPRHSAFAPEHSRVR
jgi:hypothetical protein